MLLLYNALLGLAALLALPVVCAALLLRPRYRAGLAQRLGFLPAAVQRQLVGASPLWVHAPSVGEVVATGPFVRELKGRCPGRKALISVLTPAGYDAAKASIPEADAVIYFPLDHAVIAGRVLDRVRPSAFFFTETEIWPNFLLSAARRGIPAFLVSGRVSARTIGRLRLLGPLFRRVLARVRLFCVQTEADAQRLRALGVPADRLLVTGNFKADAGADPGDTGRKVLEAAGLAGRPVLVAASTHRGEEVVVLRAHRRLCASVPGLLLLLAPRHPQRFAEVEALLGRLGWVFLRRSRAHTASGGDRVQVLLLDTLGELSSFYVGASLAFVGGSLVDRGGHSVVEPALARVPVLFGPHMRNFAALAEELLREDGARQVTDEESLCREALSILGDCALARRMGASAFRVMARNRGAVARTLDAVSAALA